MAVKLRSLYDVGILVAAPIEFDLAGKLAAHVRFDPPPKDPPIGLAREGRMAVETALEDAPIEAALQARDESSPMEFSSEELRSFGDRVAAEHHEIAERCVSHLRWRFNLGGGPEAIAGGREFTWATPDGRSGTVPENFGWHMTVGLSRSPGFEVRPSAGPLSGVLDGPQEPLGHVLLREASVLLGTNPRASLVMAVAALEVGTKSCIAVVAPATAWLLERQAPAIDQLLGSYLPTVIPPGPGQQAFPLPPATLGAIGEALSARNQLVHQGQVKSSHPLVRPGTSNLSSELLSDLLRTIHRVLYRLDVVRGYTWAMDYIAGPKVVAGGGIAQSPPATRTRRRPYPGSG